MLGDILALFDIYTFFWTLWNSFIAQLIMVYIWWGRGKSISERQGFQIDMKPLIIALRFAWISVG